MSRWLACDSLNCADSWGRSSIDGDGLSLRHLEISGTRRSRLVWPDACFRHLEGGMFTWDRTSVLGLRRDKRGVLRAQVWLITALLQNLDLFSVRRCALTKQFMLPNMFFWYLLARAFVGTSLILPVFPNVKKKKLSSYWKQCIWSDNSAAVHKQKQVGFG